MLKGVLFVGRVAIAGVLQCVLQCVALVTACVEGALFVGRVALSIVCVAVFVAVCYSVL